jgi:hypothetical protein
MIHLSAALITVLLFYAASVCLFGFIAWKPHIWVAMTPFKWTNNTKLMKVYRWMAVIVLCGIPIDLLLRLVFHY